MKRIFISFIMMLILFIGCQNETAPSINVSGGNNSPTPNIPNGNGGKITSLQAIINDPETGDTIDCSLYNITDYNATVDKAVTIKNANMQGDTLKVTSSGVVLENVSKAAVNTNSSLKISGSSLSSLSIGNVTNGRGELLYSVGNGRGDDQAVVVELEGATVVREADLDLAGASIKTDSTADIENIEVKKSGAIKGNAANIRIAGSKIKLEVTDLSADNVTFVGNNTTLDVMNKESSIKNVETDEDVVCQLEMEEGLYANMNNPTVRGENGKLTRIDKTKDAVLEKLSIDQMPEKIAYSADDTLDLTGLQIVETYRTSGIVEFTKDWEDGHLVETYTRLEANPLTTTAYSFTMKTQNVSAIGYKFKEADKGENTIVITKTDESTVISTEALKVVVLKDDEYAISYGGIDPQDITDYNLPRFYKKSNTISLNTSLTKTGFVFAGWYEDNNKGPITGWQANTKEGSVSLYARWINMLYVDPDLTDDVGYGSYDKPFKMIEQAVAAITSTGSYTIVLIHDIDKVGRIDLTKDFPVKITIQPEIGTVSIGDGSKYEHDPEYYNEYESVMFAENTELTMRNITLYSQLDALQGKSLTLENVTVRNKIRCGQALFTNVTSGDVTSAAATFTDVTIDGYFNGTDISFNNVLVTKGADFEEGSLTQVRINGYVTCDSAVFSNAELGQMTCNVDATFKNVTLTAEDRSLIANGDISLGGELSFAGKIDLAAGKKIVLIDSITTSNPIVVAITSGEQKDQIIDGRSDYVSAYSDKFAIDGTTWYLKNGQLRRYWYVDGESGNDTYAGTDTNPFKTVHKAVESATTESIIYVRGQTSEDACMDIIYDTEIYPWGYVDDETWNGGHEVIRRTSFNPNKYHSPLDPNYDRSFIKVYENAKLKARYIQFDTAYNSSDETLSKHYVEIDVTQAAGITVAGGDIDIKKCIISNFIATVYRGIYSGGTGGLSLYNTNENEKTILLEDLTIDSCAGYTAALIVGNKGFDGSPLTVEIGANVNFIKEKFVIDQSTYPENYEYHPTLIRLDGNSTVLKVTEDLTLNTCFVDNYTSEDPNKRKKSLIDVSAGTFIIDNCALTLSQKKHIPLFSDDDVHVNGVYVHPVRGLNNPRIEFNGNAYIYGYDDVALTMEGRETKLARTDTSSKSNIVSKKQGFGTGVEVIGLYFGSISGKINISGFDTGIRYLNSEEYSSQSQPYCNCNSIKSCNVAIEVGNGTQNGNVILDSFYSTTFENNTYDVKFNNTDGNKLTLGYLDRTANMGGRKLLIDLNNETVMKGIINIDNIKESGNINLNFVNCAGSIPKAFRVNTDYGFVNPNYTAYTDNDLSVGEVIDKFNIQTGYSLTADGTCDVHVDISTSHFDITAETIGIIKN